MKNMANIPYYFEHAHNHYYAQSLIEISIIFYNLHIYKVTAFDCYKGQVKLLVD